MLKQFFYMSRPHKFLLIIFFISLYSCKQSPHRINEPGKETVLRLEPGKNNPRNSEGDFIRLKDGRILFVYTHFTGGQGDDASAFLAGRYSTDNGKSWSKEDVPVLPNEGKQNIMSVSLLRLHNGKIALFYLRKNSESDCIPLMRVSDDEGSSWGEPTVCVDDIGYYVMNNDRVVMLKNGRIILPLALHSTPGFSGWFNGRIMCYYSDDEGLTWHKGHEIDNPESVTSQEPGIVELNDGNLMLFCRTNAGTQYISFSGDQGETWTPLAPGNIRSPLSPATIERIPSTGDLLLVWNNNYNPATNGGTRTPLNIAISKNDGKSWDKVKELENDPFGWYCYTAIDFTDDHVLLAHCAGNRREFSGLETTQITRLSLDWIYADPTPEPVVSADHDGTVILSSEKNADIYYTLNGSLPTVDSANLYREPIKVNKTTLLKMFALGEGLPPSNMVTEYVGKDKLLPAIDTLAVKESGLIFKYYEGEFANTGEIDGNAYLQIGITQNITLEPRRRDRFFAITYEGILTVDQDDLYTFYLQSNDGSVLYIDGYEVINNDGLHAVYEKQGFISLAKGPHKIMLKYFQAGGGKILKISWSSGRWDKRPFPQKVLYH